MVVAFHDATHFLTSALGTLPCLSTELIADLIPAICHSSTMRSPFKCVVDVMFRISLNGIVTYWHVM